MRCPFCGHIEQKVLDSRPARDGEAIRRRRECEECGRRFTTFEAPERLRIFVLKRDGSRQEFCRDKCLQSMLVACRKRPVPLLLLQEAVDRIERGLLIDFEDEVPSAAVGDRVLRELAAIDLVAYVRFVSVYKEFNGLEDFQNLLAEFTTPAPDARPVGVGH